MPIARRDPAWRRVRPWLSAAAVVTLMLAALAGPALAQDRPTRGSEGGASTSLRDPRVSLRYGRPSSLIRFSVIYRDRDGSPPSAVRVVIDGHPRAMTALSPSTHYRQGVRFGVAAKLPVGRHRARFEAVSEAGDAASARGGVIRIVARRASGSGSSASGTGGGAGPSGSGSGSTDAGASQDSDGADAPPAGAPDPRGDRGSSDDATDAPAGATTGRDDAVGDTIGPGAAAEDPGAVGAPADRVSDGVDAGRLGPSWSVAGDVGVGDGSTASPTPAAIARVDDASGPGPGGSVGGVGGPSGGPGGRVVTATVDPLELLGVSDDLFDRVFRATPVMVTTTGTVVVWAAFVFFGKRRRDGEPPAPDEVLAAHAGTAHDPIAVEHLVPPIAPVDLPPGVDPTEAGLPRWRRPSLLQARKTDPLRSAVIAASLTFADGAVQPYAGLERRRIRYRLVRLLDVPDEVRSTEIGILDEGDEVQLIDAYGAYRLVLCPDGQEGWLHRMVLGDIVRDDDAGELGSDAIDDDVLAAYLATRAKSA